MAERARTLPSRAWSATSLQTGVAYASAMSGNNLAQLSKKDLIKKLQELCSAYASIYISSLENETIRSTCAVPRLLQEAEASLAKQKGPKAKVEAVKEDWHVCRLCYEIYIQGT